MSYDGFMFLLFMLCLNNPIGFQKPIQYSVPLANHCAKGNTFVLVFIYFNEIKFVSFILYLNYSIGFKKPI
jgi:hypothetical protein